VGSAVAVDEGISVGVVDEAGLSPQPDTRNVKIKIHEREEVFRFIETILYR